MMKLKIINKSTNPLPKYESTQAAGMDIRCNIDKTGKSETLGAQALSDGAVYRVAGGL